MLTDSSGMREPHNICLYPGTGSVDGVRGDHVKVMPAYTVTKEDIDLIVERVGKVIEDVFSNGI
jgi:adenosylmethionine-8-amino-7-oxononanoate aminotransferase